MTAPSMSLPRSLQQMLVQAQHVLHLPHRERLDSHVLLSIGTAFGSLSSQSAGITAVQRRHLLLLLLTFRHLVPVVTPHLPHAYPLMPMLHDLAYVVVHPRAEDVWNDALERLECWAVPRLDEHHPQECCLTGLHVISKAMESCLTATRVSDYAAETHSGVALQYAADTYVACGDRQTHAATRQRKFWQFWLTSIVPHAWYDIHH